LRDQGQRCLVGGARQKILDGKALGMIERKSKLTWAR
jgi:hypothetical protein